MNASARYDFARALARRRLVDRAAAQIAEIAAAKCASCKRLLAQTHTDRAFARLRRSANFRRLVGLPVNKKRSK